MGNRQHGCGKPQCQREWHRQACAKWRKCHPDEAQAARLTRQVVKEAPAERPTLDPMVAINWSGVRKAVGLPSMIVMRELTKVLRRAMDFVEWGGLLGNPALVDALLRHLRHHCHTIRIDGPSLRAQQG